MAIKIKIRRLDKSIELPKIINKGEWIDLAASETTVLNEENRFKLIKLNNCIAIEDGFEASVLPRSGTFNKFHITMANSEGIIDKTYCGNKDIWRFPALFHVVDGIKEVTIPKGARICQFKISLSQKATVWQKLKWLFSTSIVIEEVDSMDGEDRGGFGTTGTFQLAGV